MNAPTRRLEDQVALLRDRVERLEQELAELRKPATDRWWERAFGQCDEDPLVEEVHREIAAAREADRRAAREAADAEDAAREAQA